MNSASFGERGGSVARVVGGSVRVGCPGAPGCTTTGGALESACCAQTGSAKKHVRAPATISPLRDAAALITDRREDMLASEKTLMNSILLRYSLINAVASIKGLVLHVTCAVVIHAAVIKPINLVAFVFSVVVSLISFICISRGVLQPEWMKLHTVFFLGLRSYNLSLYGRQQNNIRVQNVTDSKVRSDSAR